MIRIRGGSGLGDAIYLRPIVAHYMAGPSPVEVCSDHAGVFVDMDCKVSPFSRDRIDVLAHYTQRKFHEKTNQWQDICISARCESVELRSMWYIRNAQLVDRLKQDAAGRPIVLVHGGRIPMGRTDGFGKELMPMQRGFDYALQALDDCFLVRVGKGADAYFLDVDVDLNGSTSVPDLLDLGSVCDAVVGQCSLAIPLAEIFDKPLLCIWAASGMHEARHPYIKAITPEKVLSKPTSQFVVDEWTQDAIYETARRFFPRKPACTMPA